MNVSDGPLPEQVLRNFWSLRGGEGGRETAGRDRNGDDCVKVCALLTFPLCSPPFFPPSLTWSETESPVFSHGRSPDTSPPPLLPPPPSPPPHLHPIHTYTVYMNDDVFVERVRNKFMAKKPPGIQLGFEPKTFRILVRCSYH